jgi:hypothetical protein
VRLAFHLRAHQGRPPSSAVPPSTQLLFIR